MIEFRWITWQGKDGMPPGGAIPVCDYPALWNVLQYRERENMNEIGLQDPIWSEWKNT